MNTSLYQYYRPRIQMLIFLVATLNVVFLIKIFNIQIFNHDKYTAILTEETVQISKK